VRVPSVKKKAKPTKTRGRLFGGNPGGGGGTENPREKRFNIMVCFAKTKMEIISGAVRGRMTTGGLLFLDRRK